MHHIFLNSHGGIEDPNKMLTLPKECWLVCFGPKGSVLDEAAIQEFYEIAENNLATDVKTLKHQLQTLWLLPRYHPCQGVIELMHPTLFLAQSTCPDLFMETLEENAHAVFKKQRLTINWRQSTHYDSPPSEEEDLLSIMDKVREETSKKGVPTPLVFYWLCCQSNPELEAVNIERVVTHEQLQTDHALLLSAIRTQSQIAVNHYLKKYAYGQQFINHTTGKGKLTALHLAYARGNDALVKTLIGHGANQCALDALGRKPKSYRPPPTPSFFHNSPAEITNNSEPSFCHFL